MFENFWHKKEKPFQGFGGFGGGATGLGLGAGAAPFEATGGSANAPGNGYKYHTFYNSSPFAVPGPGPGNFEVTSGTRECYVMVLGGGGGAGHADGAASSGGGAGGMCYHSSFELGPGTYAVTIGDGGPISNTSGGHVKGGNPGASSTFIGPGSSFTMTGQGGKGGHAPNGSINPNWNTETGCGCGNLGPQPSGWTSTAGQPTCPQPGVPAGYVNLGWPGGRVDPTSYFTYIADQMNTLGGAGGGCGGAGGGLRDTKVRGAQNPVMPTPQRGYGDYHAQTGGSGWVAPEILEYAQVFGPNWPHISGASPQENQYGGGGSGSMGTYNSGPGDSPYGTQYGSPGLGPPPGSYNPPLGNRYGATSGYGGGGFGAIPVTPSSRPIGVPLGRRTGTDWLGGGGVAGPAPSPPTGPTHPQCMAGAGGSGLVVIAYVDVENGGSEWNSNTTTAPVAIWGGGGAGGQGNSVGGGGAYYSATLNLTAGTYTFVVGSSGCPDGSPEDVSNAGYGGAPARDGGGGGGGGYTACMRKDFTPTGDPVNFKGMGSNTSYSPNGPERNAVTGPNAAPYADLAMVQQHSILVVGGGGGAGESGPPLGGGGGGGYAAGLPAAKVGGTWPFVGGGEGGQLDRGGVGGTGGTGTGRAGIWMCGGWAGGVTDGASSGGGGYFGGGQGCGQSGGSNTELSGGGSGHIDPEYASPGASGENGNPGIASPNPGYAGGQSSPLFPGSAGRGGYGQPNANVGAGAFVFGPHTGTMTVVPPGGSPESIPGPAGKVYNTAGVYKLIVS